MKPALSSVSYHDERPTGSPSPRLTTGWRALPSASKPCSAPSAEAATDGSSKGGSVWSELPPRSMYSAASPSTSTTEAPAARGSGRLSPSPRRGQGTAAPYGLAGSAAARRWTAGVSPVALAGSRTERSRSSAPARHAEVPQGVEDVPLRSPAGVGDRALEGAEERRPASGEVVADGRMKWRVGRFRSVRPAGRQEQLAAGAMEHDPAIVATQAPVADPGDLAQRAELVEEPPLVAGAPRRADGAPRPGG